ncbi:MAG: glycosyltransferase, partial [Desulfobacteraceae bacterium]|nr:glycosyltransferase [Desulfobacteraceae bacterium]
MNLTSLAIAGACIWIVILLLPWRPWATSESLDAAPDFSEDDLSDITVLIPARNEAGVIETTLSGLKAQGDGLNIILVDDQSVAGTAHTARTSDNKNLRVVSGT